MNRKGNSTLASKTGFYILFILLFVFAVGYSVSFIERGEIEARDLIEIEKSVIANRVVSCLSGNYFGEIDLEKYNLDGLRNCLKNDNYGFLIKLTENEDVVFGDLNFRAEKSRRYVLIEGEKSILEVTYSKNVAN
jgi:hypothetical protein